MAKRGDKPVDLNRENAELRRQLAESLAQQQAIAEVLGVINASPGDLAPVFDAMLEKAMRLCEAAFGGLWLFRDSYVAAAVRGVPQAYADYLRDAAELPGPGTGAYRFLHGERSAIHNLDLAGEAPYLTRQPGRVALVELGGARTALQVPLRKDGTALGLMTIYRQEVRPFSAEQIALVENFAAQAVIAMENARLITETREALEQQTATAEVLGVINASPGDLAPVFDAILEKAHSLCGAAHGALHVRDGEHFSAVATQGLPQQYDELVRRPFLAFPGSPQQRLLQGERLIHVPDATLVEWTSPIGRAARELTGTRTLLFVPLRKDDILLGYITAYRQEVRPFTDKQIALLQNFAAQAVIAMENARLITETREALEQQTATAEVLQVINSSPGDLKPVFDVILEKSLKLCDAVNGHFYAYDGELLHPLAAQGERRFVEWMRHRPPFRPAAVTPLGRLFGGEPIVHFADAVTDGAFTAPELRELVDIGNIRTTLIVGLRKDDVLLGSITVFRQEVRPFTDKQIALLQNFAAQAVIAMENARLITETREALDQQTATAEVLQVINSSPGDLAPVFDAILEKAHTLCGADHGSLQLYDGEMYRAVALRGAVLSVAEQLRRARRPDPNHPTHRLFAGELFVHVPDLAEVDTPGARNMVKLAGLRTVLYVALRKEHTVLGFIGVGRKEVRPFSEKQIALLQNFAAQAVIAMENARLITETREALEQQTATAEVLQIINASPGDLAPVFDAMLEKAVRLLNADFGILWRFEDGLMRLGASYNVADAFIEHHREPMRPGPESGPGRMMRGGSGFITGNFLEFPPYLAGDPAVRSIVELAGARSAVIAPLRKDGAALGSITIYRKDVQPFSEKQLAVLENFAAQAVIAIENARLITETREALEQQTATAEVLGVINASPGDLAPVFDAMLEKALSLCEAAQGTLRIYDGEKFNLVAVKGEEALVEAVQRLGPIIPAPHNPWTPLVKGDMLVHIVDSRETPGYREIAATRERIDRGGIRTWLAVPLRRGDVLLGAFAVYRREVRPFSDKQIALLQNFAAQAVIAMENARLLGELRQRTDEVAELNRGLEARVAEQVEELGRIGRLKRFLAPQLAELIVSQGDENILESHRREIVVVFCDLRGYTAFTETAEPEEVLDFLREYHGALGPLVAQFEGTLDQFSGDGIMVFFNDPVPIPDPAERAVKMAVAMRETALHLSVSWRRRGRDLGFGVGIAQGYATLGQIGFAERSGYTAIGTVCNVAARLCGEAKDGQILISQRVAAGLEGDIALEDVGALSLKGLSQPIVAFNVAEQGGGAGRLRLV